MHHLVHGDARPAPVQRGALRRDVAAHTSARLAILNHSKRDHRGKDGQSDTASHVFNYTGVLSRYQAAAAIATITMTMTTGHRDLRRWSKIDPSEGGLTLGSEVARPHR
jgi:hypothetical protein